MISPENDLKTCEMMLRKGSKSFWTASRLLPARVRQPTLALYAFCRAADDAVDDASSVSKLVMVEKLRQRLDRVYASRQLRGPVERAFSTVCERFEIPKALPEALIEGMEWDARGHLYETEDDLVAYAARVAGTVGVMMTLVMGPRHITTLARACDLGVAMQLTNIARDIGEDARMGRVYLPGQWLNEAGLDREEFLKKPAFDDRLAVLTKRLLDNAEQLYARSDLGIPMLPRDCRIAIRAARLVYSDIGREIRKAGYNSVDSRAFTTRSRKIWLVFRSLAAGFGLRSSNSKLGLAPTLAPTRFLLESVKVTT